MGNKIKRFFVVLIYSALIELIVFQSVNIWKIYRPNSNANQTYTLSDFEVANWQPNEDGTFTSAVDPILVCVLDGQKIDEISIVITASQSIPYIEVFYLNEKYVNYGEVMIRCDEVKDNRASIDINDKVKALRLDLGDDPGVILSELSVVVNPVEINISISRIVAMMMIYWCGVFLFSLQKMPDYRLEKTLAKTEGDKEPQDG